MAPAGAFPAPGAIQAGSALPPNLPLRPALVGDALSGSGENPLALLIQAQGDVMVPAGPDARGGGWREFGGQGEPKGLVCNHERVFMVWHWASPSPCALLRAGLGAWAVCGLVSPAITVALSALFSFPSN